jgi:ribonuclease HII
MGIDEAGRGCVLGDLVVAAFVVDDLDDDVLRAAGAADSKRLSHKRRLSAREALSPHGEADVRRITPTEIDAGNLNQLEEATIVALIERWRPDHVTIDALGHPRTLPALVERLLGHLSYEPELLIEPKADHHWPVVGAASIFAKTARDEALAEVDAQHGPLGSGYPSDPTTRRWLSAWAASRAPWPSFVRTRWQTIRDLAQQSLV